MADYAPIELAYNYIEPEGCLKDKAPIVFLHGVTSNKELWFDVPNIVANATKRKTYVVDSRNHGDSPWTDEFNFDANVDDCLHFMDTIKAPSAILIGHSMGGLTSIKVALREPERVEKLVVEDINVRTVPRERLGLLEGYLSYAWEAVEKIPPEMDEKSAMQFVRETIFKNYTPEIVAKYRIPEPHEYDLRIQLKKSPKGNFESKLNIAGLLKAFKSPAPIISEFSGIYEGPTCFIYGLISPYQVGSDKENTKKFFPYVEFAGIEDATHSVHIERKKEFTDALLKFLLKE